MLFVLPLSLASSCARACCRECHRIFASSLALILRRNAGNALPSKYGPNMQLNMYPALLPSVGNRPLSFSTCTMSVYSSPNVLFPIAVVRPRYSSSPRTRVSETYVCANRAPYSLRRSVDSCSRRTPLKYASFWCERMMSGEDAKGYANCAGDVIATVLWLLMREAVVVVVSSPACSRGGCKWLVTRQPRLVIGTLMR